MPYSYLTPPPASFGWGKITGDLEDQNDLQAALDGKSDSDHNHDGEYEPADATILKEADIVDNLESDSSAAPLSAAAGKSLKSTTDVNALEIRRLRGIELTNSGGLLHCYNHNCKPIAPDSYTSWADGFFDGSLGATHGDDTTNYKVGAQAISITTTETSERFIVCDITDVDLTEFPDGSDSAETDYVVFSVFCPDTSKIDSAKIYLGDTGNYFSYDLTALLPNNDRAHVTFQKSSFGSTGSPNWNSVSKIAFGIASSDGASVTFSIDPDTLQLVRKDVTASAPNPLQYHNDGTLTRLFEISSGTPYLGYDGSNLVLKGLSTTLMFSEITFDELNFKFVGVSNATQTAQAGLHNTDGLYLHHNLDTIRIQSNSNVLSGPVSFPVDAGDEITITARFLGGSVSGRVSSGAADPVALFYPDATSQSDGKVRLAIYEDAAMKSFVASSSPVFVY